MDSAKVRLNDIIPGVAVLLAGLALGATVKRWYITRLRQKAVVMWA
jgi:hypothetical protein